MTRLLCLAYALLAVLPVVARAQATAPPPADSARVVLDAALDSMQAMGYYTDRVDWPSVRARAYAQASGARTPAEAYPAIRAALTALGDRHSFLLTDEPEPAADAPPAARPRVAADLLRGLHGRVIPGATGPVGYVRVPFF